MSKRAARHEIKVIGKNRTISFLGKLSAYRISTDRSTQLSYFGEWAHVLISAEPAFVFTVIL
jgi:hypothetical protein